MADTEGLPKSRRHIFVYDEDWEFLERHFGPRAPTSQRIGVGNISAEIIHAKVAELRARELERISHAMAQPVMMQRIVKDESEYERNPDL